MTQRSDPSLTADMTRLRAQRAAEGLDGSTPMRPGGAQRLPNLYTDPIPPPPERDTTTPAAELQFLRKGIDPTHWCPRCGVAVANEGQEIHRQHHAELSERINMISKLVGALGVRTGLALDLGELGDMIKATMAEYDHRQAARVTLAARQIVQRADMAVIHAYQAVLAEYPLAEVQVLQAFHRWTEQAIPALNDAAGLEGVERVGESYERAMGDHGEEKIR
jgi:hypothetical protein